MTDSGRNYVFQSTKTYTHSVGLSCCFRQWRADSHCRFLHGYALEIKLTFEGELDERNWVQDFGGLKPFKQWLENAFDHKTAVAKDDPHIDWFQQGHNIGLLDLYIVGGTGCELFANMVMDAWYQEFALQPEDLIKLVEVEVREHAGNSAKCILRPEIQVNLDTAKIASEVRKQIDHSPQLRGSSSTYDRHLQDIRNQDEDNLRRDYDNG